MNLYKEEERKMALSVALKNKITNFLTSLPNINDSNGQQAFIHRAGLDKQLQDQIKFPGSPGQFVELLVPQLVQYGQLEDGRNALEAVLEAAKGYVGSDRRAYCDDLIEYARAVPNGEEQFPNLSSKPIAVKFHIEGDIQDFSETKRQDLMDALAALLKIEKSSIQFFQMTPARSFHVIMKLPGDAALEFVALFKTNSERVAPLLWQFSVKSINIIEGEELGQLLPHQLNTPVPTLSIQGNHEVYTTMKIYISYIDEDRESAHKLYHQMESIPSIRQWMDERCLLPGEERSLFIEEAIKASRFFIALISRRTYDATGIFQRELRIALDRRAGLPSHQIFIIPILLEENSRLPVNLKHADLHCANFFENWDEGFKMLLKSINRSYEFFGEYLGRIDRARCIVNTVNDLKEKYETLENDITIRMRATFTSMSNIKHYQGKKIEGLSDDEASTLDSLLEMERDSIINLINLPNVKLKCICWPKRRCLSKKYYSYKERKKRFNKLKKFLEDSLNNHLERRQILCNQAGMHGNQLIINNEIAIIANPESGGYTKTSIFDEQQTVDIIVREYENLFNQIMKTPFDIGKITINKRMNERLLLDTLIMVDNEFEQL